MELLSETHERKAKQLDAEKTTLETQAQEKDAKYNAVKQELDQTLKDLEGL